MNTDIRISVSFRNHRKRKRLKMILGACATDYLLDLWISTAMNRPSGVLTGMDETDIALDSGWEGDPKEFVDALLKCGFMDFDGQCYSLHDWEDHQGYVVHADVRKERAKKAAAKRWENKDIANSDKEACSEHAHSMPQALEQHAKGNAPSPAPIPIPIPNPEELSEKHSVSHDSPFSLPCEDGSEFTYDDIFIAAARKAYPLTSVEKEIAKARAWLEGNPTRKKTRRGMKKFFNGWLARSQGDAEKNQAKICVVETTGRQLTAEDMKPAKWLREAKI